MAITVVVVGLVLAILGWLTVRFAAAVIRGAVRIAAAIAPAWWWFSGHHLDGRHRTNAGWLEPGTKALTANGRASRWAHRPRAYRAAWRTGGTLGVLLLGVGLVADQGATVAALLLLGGAGALLGAWSEFRTLRALVILADAYAVFAAVVLAGLVLAAAAGLAAAGLVLGGRRAWRAVGEVRHGRQWVSPLHKALAGPIGVAVAARPKSWLTVPRDYAGREGAEIRIDFPEGFALGGESSKAQITEIVTTKLALEQPKASWHLAGRNPHVIYTVQVPPPNRVSYADVRQLIAEAKPAAPLAGLGRGRKPVHVDLDLDSPHAIFSMASGTGKSVVLRTLVAQELARGGVALIMDIKRLSHAWARGLPNVWYCRDIAEIHEAALWLAEETDRRNRVADDGADIDGNTDHVDVGPRLLVVGEELNATSGKLAKYWRQIKDKEDPNMSPAIDALGDVFFMGRQVKINILAVAQMFTARTVGGPEARENAGVRCLAGYTANNWRMLVPEIPMPKKSRVKGRIQVCVAGTAKETQVAFLSPAEARELATSGIVSQFPRGAAVGEREAMRPTAIRLRPADEPIGLRQACADGVLPMSLEAARKARTRDPEFPAPRAEGRGGEQLFDRGELAAWARNRPRAGMMEEMEVS